MAGESAVGGGAYPDVALPATPVQLPAASLGAAELDVKLRNGDPHVVARIVDNRVTLDLRTVLEAQEASLEAAVLSAWT